MSRARACTVRKFSLSLSLSLSRSLWGYLNIAEAGTTAAADVHKVKRLNRLEAWRHIVVPLKLRSDAKRNAVHISVHVLPRSKNLSSVINDLDDREKVVEEFEFCGCEISDNDRRTVLLKKLLATTHSSLVSSLRKRATWS